MCIEIPYKLPGLLPAGIKYAKIINLGVFYHKNSFILINYFSIFLNIQQPYGMALRLHFSLQHIYHFEELNG